MQVPKLRYPDLLLCRMALTEYLLRHRGEGEEGVRRDAERLVASLGNLIERVLRKRKTTVTISIDD